MTKKSPQLRLVSEEPESSAQSKEESQGNTFDVVPFAELSIPERRRVDRILKEVSPQSEVLAVACTPRNWDLRPVLAPKGQESASLIRFLGPEVTLSITISARMNDLLERLTSVNELPSHLLSWGVFEGQLWYRRVLVEQTLSDLFEVRVPISIARAYELALGLIDTVSTWHARGIAHGHITATNIYPQPNGKISLLDAGVAVSILQASRALGLEDFPRGFKRSSFAPELLIDDEVEYSADIFGAGQVLTQLFSIAWKQYYQTPAAEREQLSVSEEELEEVMQAFSLMTHKEPGKRPGWHEMRELLSRKKVSFQDIISQSKQIEEKGSENIEMQAEFEEPKAISLSHAIEEEHLEQDIGADVGDTVIEGVSPNIAHDENPLKKRKRKRRRRKKRKTSDGSESFVGQGEDSEQQFDAAESTSEETFYSADTLDEADAVDFSAVFDESVSDKNADEVFEDVFKEFSKDEDISVEDLYFKPSVSVKEEPAVLDVKVEPAQELFNEPLEEKSAAKILAAPLMQSPRERKASRDPEDIAALKEAILKRPISQVQSFGKPPVAPRTVTPPPPPPQAYQAPRPVHHRRSEPAKAQPLRQEEYGYVEPQMSASGMYQFEPLRHPPRKKSSISTPTLLMLTILGFGFFMFALSSTKTTSIDEPAPVEYVEAPQPAQSGDLRVEWESGMPSRMANVALAVVGDDEAARYAEIVIVNSAMNPTTPLPNVNPDLLRVAFDQRWEQELTPSDRKAALSLALIGLLRENLPKNLPQPADLHPGVILGLTASAGPDVANRVLSTIPAARLTKLPAPVGQAFAEIIGTQSELRCNDQAVMSLARFFSKGLEDSADVKDFLATDTVKRLRAFAVLFSYDNNLARRALKVLIEHPNMVIDHEYIEWGRRWSLGSWRDTEDTEKLFLLAGIQPSSPVGTAHIGKLFAHPARAVRAHAIDFTLENIKLRHPGAYDVLRYLKEQPEILTAKQTVQLAQIIEDPERVRKEHIAQWFDSKPPVSLVEMLLVATANEKRATRVDFAAASYLKANNWNPGTDLLHKLLHHPEDLTRLFIYNRVYTLSDSEMALIMLEKARNAEKNSTFKKQLTEMTEALRLR